MLGYRPGAFLYYALKYMSPAFIWVSNADNNETKLFICSQASKEKTLTLMVKHVKLTNKAIKMIC